MDDLMKKLNEMAKGAQDLEKKESLSFSEIFTDDFAQNHTVFKNMDSFWSHVGVETTEEFKAMPDEKIDAFVATHSDFSTFQEMFNKATSEYISHQLGF